MFFTNFAESATRNNKSPHVEAIVLNTEGKKLLLFSVIYTGPLKGALFVFSMAN